MRYQRLPWRAEEDAILLSAVPGETPEETRRRLARAGHVRSRDAVLQRRKTLGFKPGRAAPWDGFDGLLRDGHAEGASYEEIARRICDAGRAGTTKNAAISRARLLGLPQRRRPGSRIGGCGLERPKRVKPPRAPKLAPPSEREIVARPGRGMAPARPAPVEVAAAPAPVEVAGPVDGIAVLDAMNTDACRWPLPIPSLAGEGLTMRVCGAPRQEGCSYCRKHLRDAYQPGTAATPRAPAEGRRSGENRAALAAVVMGRAA